MFKPPPLDELERLEFTERVGINLSHLKLIANSLDGAISCKSSRKRGAGTSFCFSVPVEECRSDAFEWDGNSQASIHKNKIDL